MKKTINFLLGIVLVILGVTAAYFQISKIVDNDLGILEGLKISVIVNIVLVIAVFVLTLVITKNSSKKLENEDKRAVACLALIPYILVIFIYSFVSLQGKNNNVLKNGFTSLIGTCIYAFLPVTICTSSAKYIPTDDKKEEQNKSKKNDDSGFKYETSYIYDEFGNTVGKTITTAYKNGSYSTPETTEVYDKFGNKKSTIKKW